MLRQLISPCLALALAVVTTNSAYSMATCSHIRKPDGPHNSWNPGDGVRKFDNPIDYATPPRPDYVTNETMGNPESDAVVGHSPEMGNAPLIETVQEFEADAVEAQGPDIGNAPWIETVQNDEVPLEQPAMDLEKAPLVETVQNNDVPVDAPTLNIGNAGLVDC